jgi:hypothetical protein
MITTINYYDYPGNQHINKLPFELNLSSIMPLLNYDDNSNRDEIYYFLIENKYFGIILSEKNDDNDKFFQFQLYIPLFKLVGNKKESIYVPNCSSIENKDIIIDKLVFYNCQVSEWSEEPIWCDNIYNETIINEIKKIFLLHQL